LLSFRIASHQESNQVTKSVISSFTDGNVNTFTHPFVALNSDTVTAQVLLFTEVTHVLFIVAQEELNVIHIQVPAIISAQVSLCVVVHTQAFVNLYT
jgi:hypothetical protein